MTTMQTEATKDNVVYLAIGFAVCLVFFVFLCFAWTKCFKMKSLHNIIPPGNGVILFQELGEGVIWRCSEKQLFWQISLIYRKASVMKFFLSDVTGLKPVLLKKNFIPDVPL